MHAAAFAFCILTAAALPYAVVQPVALLVGAGLLLRGRRHLPRRVLLTCVLLSALPVYQWQQALKPPPQLPALPDVAALQPYTELDKQLPEALVQNALAVLDAGVGMADPRAGALFADLDLPPYVSLSLVSLNMAPISWEGRYFRGDYTRLEAYTPELTVSDGRLMYATLLPIPNEAEARGFLVVEVMMLTEHRAERAHAWLGVHEPAFLAFQPVVVEEIFSDILYRLACALGVAPPPFDIHLISEPPKPHTMDAVYLGWALLLALLLLMSSRGLGKPHQWRLALPCLLVLAVPLVESRDSFSVFASYVFGTDTWLGLAANPFRFFMSVVLLFLLTQSLLERLGRGRPLTAILGFVVVFVLGTAAPNSLQRAATFSFVHPLEAFASPGAALAFLAFLLSFAVLVLLLDATPALRVRDKLPAAALCLASAALAQPGTLFAGVSLVLAWLFKDLRAGLSARAALAVLCFYPYLVITEQADEVAFVQHQLLDEITLMGERNYFRMGRLIQRLPQLEADLARGEHPHLMEMFARKCGLLENEIDFSLSLVGPGNRVISELNHHLTTNRLRALSSPLNRIESYAGGPDASHWMSYRQTLVTDFGDFDFTVLLGNDYQNLSLVRAPRTVGESEVGTGDGHTPYFAYIFEVFDREGHQLYSQGTSRSEALQKADLQRLRREPVFWRVEGRNTVFFINVKDTLYRITHKATPLKMILARFLSLWTAAAALMALIRLTQRPGKPLTARWRRSFSMKLAAYMFLASVLPTATLGFLLVRSIRENQTREELSFAQARMLAARNLFRGLEDDGGDALGGRGGRGPRTLPLENYSRILGEDLSLYIDGTLVNTNQPEMYRMGIMPRRLPFAPAHNLLVDNAPFVLSRASVSERVPAVAYASVPIGRGRQGVLAMTIIPFSQRQDMRLMEQLEFSLSLLFGLLFVMAGFTRFIAQSFLQPVSAITRSATRMAMGLIHRPITLARQDELQRMVAAFNTMQERVHAGQTQLRQQLRLLDETVGSMSSGLFGFDSRGRLIMENAVAWKLLQLETRVTSLDALVAAEAQLAPLARMFDEGVNDEIDFQLEREGEVRQIIGKVRMVKALKEGDVRCIMALEDITDAMAANRFKAWAEMARRVAHEIKNPLTPIQLEIDYLNKLYKDRHPAFEQALDEATTEIRGQVEHLKHIATEFSDYARPLQLQRADTSLTALLEEIVDPYEKTLEGVVIARNIQPGVRAMVDARLLRRAIHNLVVNAVQAMAQEGTLTLMLRADAHQAELWVQDTGPGIPEEDQAKVFEAYFSTKAQGSGLGLVIARKYFTSHGGNLHIDPAYKEGTRFIAHIPLQETDAE